MRAWETFWKLVGYGIVGGLMVLFGVYLLLAPHANANQIVYVDGFIGVGMIGFGALTFLYGLVITAAIAMSARAVAREKALHITPRGGPPATPPPWGMGDVGRPGVVKVDRMAGLGGDSHGGARVVSFRISHVDVPIVIGALLAWTAVACLLWMNYAPQH